MSDDDERRHGSRWGTLPETDGRDVPCRRLAAPRRIDAHLQCPYCFGSWDDVASREHGRFCDYDPQQDPVSYGFPSFLSRLQ